MKKVIFIFIILFSPFLRSINAQNNEWHSECKSSKTIENLKFTFPSDVDMKSRDHYIKQNVNSIKECLSLIGEKSFTDSIEVEFLKDRISMKKYLGWPASGMACPDRKTMFCIVAEKTPIKHEWMHMISMLKWGKPSDSLTWLNEGLATYADNCFKYPNQKVYAYFIQNEKLIKDEDLIDNFYGQSDVISYFQAAYLVEYLLDNYGINKFKMLWQSDMSHFNKIYEQSFSDITNKIKNRLIEKYPTTINIEWTEIEKGCY